MAFQKSLREYNIHFELSVFDFYGLLYIQVYLEITLFKTIDKYCTVLHIVHTTSNPFMKGQIFLSFLTPSLNLEP